MSPLVMSKTLGLSFDTLTGDDKYSLGKSENLPQPIQTQLSKKQKNFFHIFCSIFETSIKV